MKEPSRQGSRLFEGGQIDWFNLVVSPPSYFTRKKKSLLCVTTSRKHNRKDVSRNRRTDVVEAGNEGRQESLQVSVVVQVSFSILHRADTHTQR